MAIIHKVSMKSRITVRMIRILLGGAILLGLNSGKLYAQLLDSAEFRVGTMVSVASQDYLPLWLVAERWGTISDQPVDVTSYIAFHNKHVLHEQSSFQNYVRSVKRRPASSISYGASLYNNQLLRETSFQEAYVKAKFHHWQLAVGRYREAAGNVPGETTSGSLGISKNATPIPRVSVGLAEYMDIPFITPGWVQVKGQASIGWMGPEAFVDKAKFHHRSLYFQVGKTAFVNRRRRTALTLYGGLNQFVIWGGEHPEQGPLSNRWLDLAKPFVPGNNLGFFDYGFTFLSQGIKVRGYTQSIFEGKTSVNPFRIKDRMVGLSVSDTRKGSFFPTITLEALNTTWQDPDRSNIFRESDYNFYNNTTYEDGWTYNGRILGTPLFVDRERAIHYFGPDYNTHPTYDWNIVNNRLNAIHLGIKGQIPFMPLYYRTLGTYTINHGNYYIANLFTNRSRKQYYLMQELSYYYHGLRISGTLGADVGGFSRNVGALLGVEYNIYHHIDKEYTGPMKYRGRRSRFRRGW